MRTLTLAVLLITLAGCAMIQPYNFSGRPPWDPDPRKGESFLNQRTPQCSGRC